MATCNLKVLIYTITGCIVRERSESHKLGHLKCFIVFISLINYLDPGSALRFLSVINDLVGC